MNRKYIFIKSELEELSEDNMESIFSINVDLMNIEDCYQKLDFFVNQYQIDTVITKKQFIYFAARLLWNNDYINKYILIDTNEALMNEYHNSRAVKLMWDSLAEKNRKSDDPIKISGWKRSDTGDFFSDEDMREFAENIFQKIRYIVTKESTVLEVGIASGISCYSIAPLVKDYYGVDISKQVLLFTEQCLKSKNIHNVILINCEAIEIDNENIPKVDLVLLNSVIQYFPGYNYFINVLNNAIKKINVYGYVFIGDVLDLDLYNEYRKYRRLDGATYNREQYYSKAFFERLPSFFQEISSVQISCKSGYKENELNKFRYDVLIEIDKNISKKIVVEKKRCAIDICSENELLTLEQIVEYLMKRGY